VSEKDTHHQPVNDRDLDVARVMRNKSRRSFLLLGIGATAGFAGWNWLTTRSGVGGVPYPLRRALEFNETLAETAFKATRLAPTFPREMAREPRVNGGEGLPSGFDPLAWRLEVLGAGQPRHVTLEDVKQLPRIEMTTELKCIEGWSVIVNWAGARLSDFAAEYNPGARDGTPPDGRKPPRDLVRFVALETPDKGYYVGMDAQSALHPQTLLCYEMNGAPLSIAHGAPLRLVTTVKYGIKSIKRIGRIIFTDERPPDFWAERGYDWYAGL
jgi:DMSO/TMAO reductase YedYZ molybdopterin-dependent catalytic subunit